MIYGLLWGEGVAIAAKSWSALGNGFAWNLDDEVVFGHQTIPIALPENALTMSSIFVELQMPPKSNSKEELVSACIHRASGGEVKPCRHLVIAECSELNRLRFSVSCRKKMLLSERCPADCPSLETCDDFPKHLVTPEQTEETKGKVKKFEAERERAQLIALGSVDLNSLPVLKTLWHLPWKFKAFLVGVFMLGYLAGAKFGDIGFSEWIKGSHQEKNQTEKPLEKKAMSP